MLDHTGFVVTDLAKARRFYDAVAASLGLRTKDLGPDAFLLGKSAEEPIPYLWIGTLIPSYWTEGSRAGINQALFAFRAESKEQVDAFHAAALAAEPTTVRRDRVKVRKAIMVPSSSTLTAITLRPATARPDPAP